MIAAIQRLCTRLHHSARILTILPDRGERYLDTVYNDEWLSCMRDRHLAHNRETTLNSNVGQAA